MADAAPDKINFHHLTTTPEPAPPVVAFQGGFPSGRSVTVHYAKGAPDVYLVWAPDPVTATDEPDKQFYWKSVVPLITEAIHAANGTEGTAHVEPQHAQPPASAPEPPLGGRTGTETEPLDAEQLMRQKFPLLEDVLRRLAVEDERPPDDPADPVVIVIVCGGHDLGVYSDGTPISGRTAIRLRAIEEVMRARAAADLEKVCICATVKTGRVWRLLERWLPAAATEGHVLNCPARYAPIARGPARYRTLRTPGAA